jgi:hypothetical protein
MAWERLITQVRAMRQTGEKTGQGKFGPFGPFTHSFLYFHFHFSISFKFEYGLN